MNKLYDLPYAEGLTTDQICDALFKNSAEWTPALDLEHHARLVTSHGVVVAKEVMDLIDWLVDHPAYVGSRAMEPSKEPHVEVEPVPPSIPPVNLGEADDDLGHDTLEGMAEKICLAHTRVKDAVSEARKAAREAWADVFVLQTQLAEEKAFQSEMVDRISNIVGTDVMQSIKAQEDAGVRDDFVDSYASRSRAQTERLSTSNAITCTSTPSASGYHIIQASPTGSRTPSLPPSSRLASKRRRNDDTPQGLDFPNNHKRPRLESITPAIIHHPVVVPRTILNYSSDGDGTDDTYSDYDVSSTESDSVEEPIENDEDLSKPWLQLRLETNTGLARGFPPGSDFELAGDHGFKNGSSTDDSEDGCPWNTLSDFDDEDPGDPDYLPPAWDPEDAWELEHKPEFYHSRLCLHSLYYFNYANELVDCDGVLSDGGLSTDDPDEGYRDLWIDQQASRRTFSARNIYRRPPPSLGPCLTLPSYKKTRDFPRKYTAEQKAKHLQLQYHLFLSSKFEIVAKSLRKKKFPPLDLEQRLADVLESDHRRFYFDDEEWEPFAEPSPSSHHYHTAKAKQIRFEGMVW